MIERTKDILTKAQSGGYAVGAFNTVNLETTRAIVAAAKEMKSPIIIQITEKTMEYAGGRGLFHLVKNEVEFYAPEIPVSIHLDHGHSMEIVERAIEIGFQSVMYDGSRKSFTDNSSMTKKVAEICHQKQIDIQGELGSVPYIGEGEIKNGGWDEYMTKPEEAERFVNETGIDALAVAIGNAHGFFQERKTPDFERLKKVRERVSIPLILHGASDWEGEHVKEAIDNGITCFNVDTAIRLAFINELVQEVKNQGDVSYDLRKLLGDSRKAVENVVKEKIKMFGSANQA